MNSFREALSIVIPSRKKIVLKQKSLIYRRTTVDRQPMLLLDFIIRCPYAMDLLLCLRRELEFERSIAMQGQRRMQSLPHDEIVVRILQVFENDLTQWVNVDGPFEQRLIIGSGTSLIAVACGGGKVALAEFLRK